MRAWIRRAAKGDRAGCSVDVPNDLAVDGARDAVLELEVHLGHRVLGEDRGVRDVTCGNVRSVCCVLPLRLTCPHRRFRARISKWIRSDRRTDSGGLNHVADGESLDGLVLGGASRAVGATDRLDVAPAVLVAAAANQMLAMVLAAPSRVCVVAAWDMYARGVAVLGRSLLDHLCDLRRVGSAGG